LKRVEEVEGVEGERGRSRVISIKKFPSGGVRGGFHLKDPETFGYAARQYPRFQILPGVPAKINLTFGFCTHNFVSKLSEEGEY
jgi:hypothetical protein